MAKPGLLETDQNINTAVRQIRAALGDDAAHPLFVETVVGKGYRFISPTEEEQSTQPLAAENTVASKIDSSSGLPRVTAEQPAILEAASIPADSFANLPVYNSFGRQIPVWLAPGAAALVMSLLSGPCTTFGTRRALHFPTSAGSIHNLVWRAFLFFPQTASILHSSGRSIPAIQTKSLFRQ